MKAIFLSENKEKLESVYSDETVQRIKKSVCLDTEFYQKKDVLNDPDKFSDVKFIFSTWGMPKFTEDEIKAYFPSLECIFYGAGSVQGFARPFISSKVRVFSAWAANAVPVAEYTVAQIILANKDFFALTRMMQAQSTRDAKERSRLSMGNYGARVGIIGCGMIGSMVATRLKEYKLEVVAFDPFLSDEKAASLGVKKVSLEELFSTCKVVTNHLANNEQTKGMLGTELFERLMPYATFINTGRGAQVKEDELVKVMRERPDLTAVLDVTFPEPPKKDHPFYSLPGCFLTPHIAGSLGNEVWRMAEYMAEELEAYVSGRATRFEVSEKMLETMA